MKWLLTAIFFSSTVFLQAQDFLFKTYTTKDGLSSNDTRYILHDDKGFLWIATGNGLNRYDGNAFDHFYHNPADKNSIASNEIVSLYTDKKMNLWVGSVAGISKYDPIRQQFSNYYPDSSTGKCGRLFTSMQEDKAGRLWVGSWYELLIFDTTTKKFQRTGWSEFSAINKPAKGNNNRIVISSIVPKSAEEMWVLTSYGLYSVHTRTKKFTWYPYDGIDDYYGCHIKYIDETGSPWISSYNNGILHYNVSSKTWNKHTPPVPFNSIPNFNWSYGITPYNGDTLLYMSLDGPALFNKRTKEFITHIKSPVGTFLPATAFYVHPYRNDYWLVTVAGIIKMYPAISPFKKSTPFGKGTYVNKVFPIAENPGENILYNSAAKQVVRWNEKTGKATALITEEGAAITSELTGWYQQKNTAWLSVDDGFYKYDIAANRATHIQLPPLIFSANDLTVRNTVEDKNGTLWIRLRTQGIVSLDPVSNKTSFVKFIKPKIELSYSALYYHRQQHSLWVAVENGGVYQYDIASQKTKHFPLYQQPGVNAATITAIVGFENGDMYMSDASNGIFHYNARRGNFTQITQQDGLPVNNCHSLTIDKKGNLWIATSQGVSRYDTSTKSFLNFTNDEIIPGNLSFITTADGEQMYSCYDKDLYNWNIAAVPSKIPDAPLYIRHITINQQPVAIANSFKLPYNQNNITLRVGVISSTLYGSVDFEYSLNSENDWIKMENSHTINFSNLSPGHYKLLVRQKGNSNMLPIVFDIHPPLWKTSWFIAVASALSLAIVVWLVRRRIQGIRKQALLKQQVAETEMMALRAQMNPHFIFNCISSIDNFIQDNDKENASAWLNKFAKLIRSILDSSKNEIVPFWKDWETLQLYLELEQLRSDNKFKVSMRADEMLLNGHYRIPPLLVQPYVENAIHHGLLQRGDKNGHLQIAATLKDNQLTYLIEDNGIGRQKSAELNALNKLNHNSYGMQMSSERIQLFNEHAKEAIFITDLTDDNGNATGTKVKIVLNV